METPVMFFLNRPHFCEDATALVLAAYNPTEWRDMIKQLPSGQFSCPSTDIFFKHLASSMGLAFDQLQFNAVDALTFNVPCKNKLSKGGKLVNFGKVMKKIVAAARKKNSALTNDLKAPLTCLVEHLSSPATAKGSRLY